MSTPQSDQNLGQDRFRERWIDVAKDPKIYTDFKVQHYLVDVAEEHWDNFYKKRTVKNGENFSLDVDVSGYQARQAFAESPWNFKLWIYAFFAYFRNIMERPLDAVTEVWSWSDAIIPPFAISLMLVLFLHLWTWTAALCKNIPRWVGSKSPLICLAAFLTMLIWTSYSGYWTVFCFLLTCLTVIYSREKMGAVLLAIFFGLYFNFKFIGPIVIQSLHLYSAHEALDLGRTRIEYSFAAIEKLTPIEKAMWADYNGDTQAAAYWLEKSSDSKEKAIFAANFSSNNMASTTLLAKYEDLKKNYPDDPTIIFNLSQLYIRSQQLVQADGLRQSLDSNFYGSATVRSSAMNRLLLPAPLPSRTEDIHTEIGEGVKTYIQKAGFSPLTFPMAMRSSLRIILPWIILSLVLAFRRKAAGVCVHTGEATLSPDHAYSNLYQTVTTKRETSHPTLRQRLDLLIRRNNQMQHYQLKKWRWFFPGAASLLLDQSLVPAFMKTLVPCFFLWNIFSTRARTQILEFFHASTNNSLSSNSLSIGFLILFLITYLFFLSQNLTRSNS